MRVKKLHYFLSTVLLISLLTGCNKSETINVPNSDTSSNVSTEASSNASVNASNESLTGELMADYKIDYLPDENISFYDIYNDLMDQVRGNIAIVPDDFSQDDFCGYYSYNGNDTEHYEYLIINDGNFLMAYKKYFFAGDDKKYAGIVSDEDAFIQKIRSLPYVRLEATGDIDSVHESYGYLFIKLDGKVKILTTENIFENEE